MQQKLVAIEVSIKNYIKTVASEISYRFWCSRRQWLPPFKDKQIKIPEFQRYRSVRIMLQWLYAKALLGKH